MAQAYIFAGEDTDAVRKHALAFAKSLNCETSGCGDCVSCRTFDSSNHPDTFYVRSEKQKGIGVEEAREQIVEPMAVKPFKYKHKIFIVESPLTPQAQNALLKTIEEPAPYGVFLFLADNTHGFLPTILSRCVVKKISGDGEISPDLKFAEEIATAAESASLPQAFALWKKIEPLAKESKENLQEFLNSLYFFYGKKINNAAANGQTPPDVWLNATKAITKTKQILSQNGNTQLAIELMLLKMTRGASWK
jgi:DNA polymerase III gamma/tau subunit